MAVRSDATAVAAVLFASFGTLNRLIECFAIARAIKL